MCFSKGVQARWYLKGRDKVVVADDGKCHKHVDDADDVEHNGRAVVAVVGQAKHVFWVEARATLGVTGVVVWCFVCVICAKLSPHSIQIAAAAAAAAATPTCKRQVVGAPVHGEKL